jgi:hypothetical protein
MRVGNAAVAPRSSPVQRHRDPSPAASAPARENQPRIVPRQFQDGFDDPKAAPPNAAVDPSRVPTRDLSTGDTGEDVKVLQDALVELKYLTQEDVATGPGEYGPRTTDAVDRFEQDWGIPNPDGQVGADTRAALDQALSGTPPPGGTPITTPAGKVSPEEAFITQYTSDYNPTGPSYSSNCGPASLAMCMNYEGTMPPGLTKEQQVDHARSLMSGWSNDSAIASDGTVVPLLNDDGALTVGTMVADGITNSGGTPVYGSSWEELDAQLAAGNPVMADGYISDEGGPGWEYKQQFPGGMGPGAYGQGTVGHLIAILGKDGDKYLVADPMYAQGPVEMTREQLALFFSPTGGAPSFTAYN